jgi:AcrR family transcriptional regulator
MTLHVSSDTRGAILDAAFRLAEGRGPEAVSMADVAREAGVSRQAVYLHYGSRSLLFVALVDHIDRVKGLGKHVAKASRAKTSLEMLDALVVLSADYIPKIHAIASAIDDRRRSDEAAAAAWDDRMGRRLGFDRRVAQWLHDDGLLHPDFTVDEAADLIWTVLSNRFWENLVIDRKWSRARYVRHVQKLLRRTLVVE